MEISGSSAASAGGLETTGTSDSSAGAGAGKISPEGKAFVSMLSQGLIDDGEMQKRIFDPVKEAIDEGSDE